MINYDSAGSAVMLIMFCFTTFLKGSGESYLIMIDYECFTTYTVLNSNLFAFTKPAAGCGGRFSATLIDPVGFGNQSPSSGDPADRVAGSNVAEIPPHWKFR